jgi:hypothetical protein
MRSILSSWSCCCSTRAHLSIGIQTGGKRLSVKVRMMDFRREVTAWIAEHVADKPGFAGAFLHGSAAWLPTGTVVPPGSDVDVIAVFEGSPPKRPSGKIEVGEVILDLSYLPASELAFPAKVLRAYHLAGSLQAPGILLDPKGWLEPLHESVAQDFAKARWVLLRCNDARERVLRNLAAVDPGGPFPAQVTSWLFGTGVTTHIVLTAGMGNPTVRRRYETVRELLADYDRLDFYEELLVLLGCAEMSRERVEQHVAALEPAFDAAGAAVRSPFFFASDLSPLGRRIAIEGSREMIARGSHREAVFWIAATYARCMTVFEADAIELVAGYERGFRVLLADLGIVTMADIVRRAGEVEAFLPAVWEVAMAIIEANPEIGAG